MSLKKILGEFVNHCYCPTCDAKMTYNKVDVIAEKIKNVVEYGPYGTRTIQYKENYVSHQINQCNGCGCVVEYPQAQDRKEYFQALEEEHHLKNFCYPILGFAGIFVSLPIFYLCQKVSSGLLMTLAILIGLAMPFVAVFFAEKYLDFYQKRKFKMAYSAVQTMMTMFIVVATGALIVTHFTPFDEWAKNGIIVISIILSCYWSGRSKIKETKLLFDIFDYEFSAEDFKTYYEQSNQQQYSYHANGEQAKQTQDSKKELLTKAAFKIFDLTEQASLSDLKSAYRQKMKQYHPDKFEPLKQTQPDKYNEAMEICKNLNNANEILINFFNKQNAEAA